MHSTTLIICDNIFDAQAIEMELKDNGIQCFLSNKDYVNLRCHPLGTERTVEIFVFKEDLSRASELIKDRLTPSTETDTCPFCGSDQLALRHKNRGVRKWFTILFTLMFAIPIGYSRQKYYCKNCNRDI